MRFKLLSALGSTAWLILATQAFAEEISTASEMTIEGNQAKVSNGDDGADAAGVQLGSDVEYRRHHHAQEINRTGRSDRSSSGVSGGGSESGGGDGGGSSDGGDSVD